MKTGSPISASIPLVLVAVTALVSVAAWASKPLRGALVLSPWAVRRQGQVHRLFTAGFIHADATHLAFNMLTLWFFAGGVLALLGTARFLALYLSAIVVGFVPTTLRYMNRRSYASLGASGAVAAVIFSAIVSQPGLRVGIPFVPVTVPGVFYGLGYVAYSAWHSYRSHDGINHDAHFTGAVYGALFTFLLEPDRVRRTVATMF